MKKHHLVQHFRFCLLRNLATSQVIDLQDQKLLISLTILKLGIVLCIRDASAKSTYTMSKFSSESSAFFYFTNQQIS